MEDYRNKTKKIQIGNVCIGGGERIAIQSMTNTKTEDVEACVAQILKLEKAGCDIIRVAVPTMEAAESIRKIKEQIHIPLVADIHFDYRLAIAAIENGADKIRINPGNIGDEKRVRAVVEKADPCRSEQRFTGETSGRKISWSNSRRPGRKCTGQSTYDRRNGI